MAYEINFHVNENDPLLSHPLYRKYSSTAIGSIILPAVQADLQAVIASNESTPVVNYLAWVIRTLKLTL